MAAMKIAILAPAWFAVPPVRYGGIEWVVAMLADGLVERGHDVTLYAAGESQTRARLVTSYDEPPSYRIGLSLPDLHHALTCYEEADQYDVVNDHSGPVAAALGGAVGTAVCHTVHGPLTGEPGRIYAQIGSVCPDVGLISLSENQRTPQPDLNWLATCHNAIDLDAYPVSDANDGFLLFLGRMAPEKGAAHAVRVAKEAGLPLKLAGKVADPHERQYFEQEIEPHLCDGIEFLGEVSHDEKVKLLQHACLTLFPVDWPEPFGLVMIESMACGTPVIATAQGAVPEVIEDGRSGIVVDSVDDMAARIGDAMRLDRHEVRAVVEERFSARRMIDDYERAYELLLRGERAPTVPSAAS
jgi:glycosyltransferase involved in cell wall biosynthesis